MGTRGRKSAAELSALTVLPGQRPEPPSELTDEQAAEWRAVVARMPTDWFPRETHQLLAQFCRHAVMARTLADKIAELDPKLLAHPEQVKHLDRLTRIAEREGRAMSALATRMRLTQQARYRAETAATAAAKTNERKPWEWEPGGS